MMQSAINLMQVDNGEACVINMLLTAFTKRKLKRKLTQKFNRKPQMCNKQIWLIYQRGGGA